MEYKILKNRKYHIPMDLIKEVEKDAIEQEKLETRLNEMTDEEYDAYVEESFRQAEEEIERGEGIPWEIVKQEAEEDMKAVDRAYKNYDNWKRLLEMKRKGAKLRYII